MRPKVRKANIKLTVFPSSFLSPQEISFARGMYGDSVSALISPMDSTLMTEANQNMKNKIMNMKYRNGTAMSLFVEAKKSAEQLIISIEILSYFHPQ